MMTRRISYNRVPLLAVALTLVFALACSQAPPDRVAFNSIDGATEGVQSAVKAYKAHCGVSTGQPGPGSCPAAEYAQAQAIYSRFQTTAQNAVDIAAKTGQTPLMVITSAAAEAVALLANLRGAK
jgi:hypothetical protein